MESWKNNITLLNVIPQKGYKFKYFLPTTYDGRGTTESNLIRLLWHIFTTITYKKALGASKK